MSQGQQCGVGYSLSLFALITMCTYHVCVYNTCVCKGKYTIERVNFKSPAEHSHSRDTFEIRPMKEAIIEQGPKKRQIYKGRKISGFLGLEGGGGRVCMRAGRMRYGGGNVLKLDCGGDHRTLNLLKTTALYNSNKRLFVQLLLHARSYYLCWGYNRKENRHKCLSFWSLPSRIQGADR